MKPPSAPAEGASSSKLVQTAEGTLHLTFNLSKSSAVKNQERFFLGLGGEGGEEDCESEYCSETSKQIHD